jgi:hypothetical protein
MDGGAGTTIIPDSSNIHFQEKSIRHSSESPPFPKEKPVISPMKRAEVSHNRGPLDETQKETVSVLCEYPATVNKMSLKVDDTR